LRITFFRGSNFREKRLKFVKTFSTGSYRKVSSLFDYSIITNT